jgi:hypothetical protein
LHNQDNISRISTKMRMSSQKTLIAGGPMEFRVPVVPADRVGVARLK